MRLIMKCFVVICLVSGNILPVSTTSAQGDCTGNVPTFEIDLTGQPAGSFVTPPVARLGNCCGTSSPDRCIQFIITLDTNAVGINFEITSGSVPPGSLFYQIDCGPEQNVGEEICISGVGPHVLTFCKPGNNVNTFKVTSVSRPLFPEPHTVREGCELLQVLGLLPETVEWNSIAPGAPGEYNSFLSCTSGCIDPSYTPTGEAPEFIDYFVCGFPQADECGFLLEVCDTVRIFTAASLTGIISPSPATYCATADGVMLSAEIEGGVAPYNFEWLNPSNQQVGTQESYFAPSTGNYTLIVQDAIGERCDPLLLNTSVSIANVSLTMTGIDASCFGASDGAASVSITGGSPPYSIQWSNGVLDETSILNLPANTYTVNVTDQGGCSAQASITINQPPPISLLLTSPELGTAGTNLSCAIDENGSADVSITGGSPPYTVLWSNGATDQAISNLGAGIYSVTVTDSQGCLAQGNITLTAPQPLVIILESPTYSGGFNISCSNGSDGSISTNNNGGTPPFTYQWNDSQNQQVANPTNLSAGIYQVIVTDGNNCQASASITLTEPSPIAVGFLAVQDVLCFGQNTGSAAAQANGGVGNYTFSWNSSPPQFGATASNLGSGIYTVTVTDGNNCVGSSEVTINQPDTPITISVEKNDVACFGESTGSATASASGGTGALTYTWNTVPVQTGPQATNLQAGSYTVTVQDANNCSSSANVTITQPSNPLTLSVQNITDVDCFGESNGAALVQASGGTPGYTYSWTTIPEQTGNSASQLEAGIYTVTVTDQNGCTASTDITISQPLLPLALDKIEQIDVLCFGESTGGITVVGIGGTPGYAYVWNTVPEVQGPTLSDIPAGVYTATVTDANGCVANLTIFIDQPDEPLAASITNVQNVLCFGESTGSATVTASGGTSGYTYLWNDPLEQTSATASGLSAGPYSIQVTDANGCTGMLNVTITQPAAPLGASITSQTNVLCFGNATGAATIQGTGGSGSYSYLWSPGGFTTGTATGLLAGNYTVTITDNNGCDIPVIVDLEITQPAEGLIANLTSPEVIGGWNIACHGDASGSINLDVSGGSPPYSYTWFQANGDTTFTQNLNSVIAGTYTVIIADGSDCILEQSITLTQPDPIDYTFEMTPSLCFGSDEGEIKVEVFGGTPDYDYSWEGPDGYTSDQNELFNLNGGIYELTVTDANGCIFYVPITVTQPEDILISVEDISSFPGGWNVSCHDSEDGSIDISATGGTTPYNFVWQGPNNPFFSSNQNVADIPGGSYEVILIDVNNCIQNLFIELLTPDSISINLSAFQFAGGAELSCPGASDGSIASVVEGGTPNYSYNWFGPAGFPGAISENLNNLPEGTYVLQITDENGCINQEAIRIDPPDSLILAVSSPAFFGGYNISCNGAADGSIQLFISGGVPNYSVAWNGPNSYFSNDVNINGLEAGLYCATVSDENGCEEIICIDLTEPEPLSALANSAIYEGGWNIDCNGNATGSIVTSVEGGVPPYFYFWDGPGFFSSNSPNISDLEAGEYCLSVFDGNTCTFDTCIVLTQPEPLNVSLTASNQNGSGVSCAGASDGSIAAIANGGTLDYSFQWSGPNGFNSTNPTIENLSAGVYCVTVTDANGCEITNCNEITEPQPISINLNSPQFAGEFNVTCFEASTGSINASVNGGTAGYTYSWTGPNGYSSSSPNPSGLLAGVYCLEITDQNNCTVTNCIELTQPALLAANPEVSPVACNSAATGSINLNINGGTAPYSYFWSNAANTESISNLDAGTYTVVVLDANNCAYEASFEIEEPEDLQLVLSSPTFVGGFNIDCNGNSSGSISQSTFGGTAPFVYSWSGPNGFTSANSSLTNIPAGTYCLAVIDANNCETEACITLTEPEILTVAIQQTAGVLCHGGQDAALNATAQGGGSGYTYSWQGPNNYSNNGSSITGLVAGEYCVTVIDFNGCPAQSCFTIEEPEELDLTLESPEFSDGYNLNCHLGSDGSIVSNIVGGSGPFTYSWTGPGNFSATDPQINNLAAGTYCLTVTDANNCSANSCISLLEPDQITIDTTSEEFSGGFGISCTGSCDGAVMAEALGGNGGFNYNWQGPFAFESLDSTIADLCAGNYFLVVTDQNGCTSSTSINISEPEELLNATYEASIFPSGTNISCWGASDGSADINILGGVMPYDIFWQGPDNFESNDPSNNNLEPGVYEITITDSNECTTQLTFELTEPDTVLHVVIDLESPTCNSGNDGSIFTTVSGGSFEYAFEWEGPGGFTSQFDFLQDVFAGNYTLLITDANGCTISEQIILDEPEAINIEGTISDATCGAADGSISTSATGGTGILTFEWDNGEKASNIGNLESGTYSILVTDENGCIANASYEVGGFNPLEMELIGQNLLCYSDSTGEISAELLNAVPPISYNWVGPDGFESGNPVLMNLSAGEYSLTVVDGNNCSLLSSIVITEPDSLILDNLFSPYPTSGIDYNISVPGGSDGSILSLIISGGSGEITGNWFGPSGFEATGTGGQNGLPAGTFSVTITDENGCSASQTITLTEPYELELPNGISPNGDGFNDGLIIRGIELFPNNELIVFNRWGNIVYRENNYTNNTPWEGMNQSGIHLPDGTYFVVVQISNNESRELKGYLELRR